MKSSSATIDLTPTTQAASWGAVVALSLGAFALISTEFMPVSLLTPIATDLQVTEGMAGQSISVSGAFAVLTSLVLPAVIGRLDRRLLMLALTALMVVSATIAATAPNYLVFMAGRAFVGVAIGGFWSLSAATVMRLVPSAQVPRALAILNGGNALALVIAAPLGSFLGGLFGWRGAFLCIVPVALAAFVWLWASLPSLPAERNEVSGNVLKLFSRPIVLLGMLGAGAFFAGQFALYTYVRPFLERVVGVDVNSLSLILFVIGFAGFLGTAAVGFVLEKKLYPTLIAIPIAMAAIAIVLVVFGASLPVAVASLALWGFLATAAPVGWWTWLARTLPDDAETGGGLMVAVIQLAITVGATLGGLLFDLSGHRAAFVLAAALLLGSAVASSAGSRLSAR